MVWDTGELSNIKIGKSGILNLLTQFCLKKKRHDSFKKTPWKHRLAFLSMHTFCFAVLKWHVKEGGQADKIQ